MAAPKTPKEHIIWMTRKMAVKTLNRMRILSAHMSTKGTRPVPLWKIHQLALAKGVEVMEKEVGVPKR